MLGGIILLLAYVGPFVIDHDNSRLGAASPRLSPNAQHFFGTDTQGRDVLTVWILGIGQTLKMALLAGIIGIVLGLVLGLVAGYFGGVPDAVIRTASDVAVTIPAIAILVLVAATVRVMTIEAMALIVATLTWMGPTRTIRAQVLTLRERGYVQVARLNGLGGVELVFREIFPNLLPFIVAQFVMAVSHGVLATVGLEALGLGPQNDFTLGMMVYWSRFYSAVLRNMWWWWTPPIITIAAIFLSLYLLSIGLDRFASPRSRGHHG